MDIAAILLLLQRFYYLHVACLIYFVVIIFVSFNPLFKLDLLRKETQTNTLSCWGFCIDLHSFFSYFCSITLTLNLTPDSQMGCPLVRTMQNVLTRTVYCQNAFSQR